MTLDPAHENDLTAHTGRSSAVEALKWLAEGHPLPKGADLSALLRATVAAVAAGDGGVSDAVLRDALLKITRLATRSELDTATFILDAQAIVPAEKYKRALDLLATKNGGSVAGLTSDAFASAQRADPFVIEMLCAVAGITYKELRERLDDQIPGRIDAKWDSSQRKLAFKEIDGIVQGKVATTVAGAIPARPVELMPQLSGLSAQGWQAVEAMRWGGVPYEVLLVQRSVGSAWMAHRNTTSNQVSRLIADQLCTALDRHGLDYVRSKGVGGDTPQADVNHLTGTKGQIGVLVRDSSTTPAYAVAISVARDSGSARKSGSTLQTLGQANVPVAVVVSGPGWAKRRETAELAKAFGGRLFSETAIGALADEIARTVAAPSGRRP